VGGGGGGGGGGEVDNSKSVIHLVVFFSLGSK